MDNNHDDDDSKSNDYPTRKKRKKKFYAIHQDIVKLIAEEQIAAAIDGTTILNAIAECKAREPSRRKKYFSLNIESSNVLLRSHTNSKADLVILYVGVCIYFLY